MLRKQLIQLIHVAKSHTTECTACGHLLLDTTETCICGSTESTPISESRYRDSLDLLTGKRSCSDMDERELQKVYGMFQRVGFTPVQTRIDPARSQAASLRRTRRSIERRAKDFLGDNWEARLNGFVRKSISVDSLEFCDAQQLRKVQGWLTRTQK